MTQISQAVTYMHNYYYMSFIFHLSVFLGTRPAYFIADMDLVREITVKHFDKFVDRMVSGNAPHWSSVDTSRTSQYSESWV